MLRTECKTNGKTVAIVTEKTIAMWNTDYNVKLYQDGWEVSDLNFASLTEANEVAMDWQERSC